MPQNHSSLLLELEYLVDHIVESAEWRAKIPFMDGITSESFSESVLHPVSLGHFLDLRQKAIRTNIPRNDHQINITSARDVGTRRQRSDSHNRHQVSTQYLAALRGERIGNLPRLVLGNSWCLHIHNVSCQLCAAVIGPRTTCRKTSAGSQPTKDVSKEGQAGMQTAVSPLPELLHRKVNEQFSKRFWFFFVRVMSRLLQDL